MAAVSNAKIVTALKEARGLVMVAARKLGVSRQQLYRRIEANPEVREALEEARDFTTDTAEAALFKAIAAGEAWAVCFYLKCQGKDRGYIERHQHEHTGRDGGPIETHELSDSDLLERAKQHGNRVAALARNGNGRKNGNGSHP